MRVSSGSRVAETRWVKAQKSQGIGMCVELTSREGSILIRDSKDPAAGELTFSPNEFEAFLDGCRRGEFDFLVAE
jgi:hypothetical protein